MSETNYKFHGLHIKAEDDAILRLYARVHNISLSPLIRNAVHEWIAKNNLNRDDLINKTARSCLSKWESQQIQLSGKVDKENEKDFLYDTLKLKTLPEEVLMKVIEKYEAYKGSAIE